jgi:hypothetical protein
MGMPNEQISRKIESPKNPDLPYFVYGALKPGMPAYERLRGFVECHEPDTVSGDLWVRDGLPILCANNSQNIFGVLLTWKPAQEEEGYREVCHFEPTSHYKWEEVILGSGRKANTLVMRSKSKGNPQVLEKNCWNLRDDPAFGPGLGEVGAVLLEVDVMLGDSFESNWRRFFRSQMAYLLLWSILERLSALCIGPAEEPTKRINRLYELPGMEEIVRKNVTRFGKVSDSRRPDSSSTLDPANAKKSFAYYYQVRSNLSHRGKAVFKEFDTVHSSLRELLAITKEFLEGLRSMDDAASVPTESSRPPTLKQPQTMSTISTLRETATILNTQPIPCATNTWGGADVIICKLPPRPPAEYSHRSEPRYVVTPCASELSWLFERLRDAFYAEKRLDGCSKIEFFGRLANAANRCIADGHGQDAGTLCRAVLHEAFAIFEEMESGSFGALGVAVAGEILDDAAAEAERTGYVSVERTLQFFKEQGLEARDA